MSAAASNLAHPLSDSLLAQFSDPTLSLLEIATRNRTSLESLALTIARISVPHAADNSGDSAVRLLLRVLAADSAGPLALRR